MKRKLIKFCTLFILLSLAAMLGFSQPQQIAQAAPGQLTYIIFATDSFIVLPDGGILYMYGFVGGRATDVVVYQNSMIAPPGSPKAYVPGALIDLNVAPATGPLGVCPQFTTWENAATGPNRVACMALLTGQAQFPAPLIRSAVNDVVEIRLRNLGVSDKNAPNDPHSIHLHGLDVNAANDGVPETSVGAIPANAAMPGAGNWIYYYFTPTHAGSYMYHCHQEADIHVQMGMFGALVVYEPTDASYISWYNNGGSSGPATGGGTLMGWNWTKETILLLSEFDVRQHAAEQNGTGGFNPITYQPQYWSINGLSFPQTIHVAPPMVLPVGVTNWFTQIWLPAHPGYDPLVVGSVGAGDKVLLRVINMGFETHPMHMHGFHGKIIGSDQRAWPWANSPTQICPNPIAGADPSTGCGMEKNTLVIGSGETYEWLLDFGVWTTQSTGTYRAGTQTRFNNGSAACVAQIGPNIALNAPVDAKFNACPAIPDPGVVPPGTYIGGPTVGPILPNPDAGTVPGALMTSGGLTPFTGQLFPFHNHDDYKATNNGVYPGGMFTMIATVP